MGHELSPRRTVVVIARDTFFMDHGEVGVGGKSF